MKKAKILIAYNSHSGSTELVAQVIADEFYQAGFYVDVIRIDKIKSIKNYSALVIGSPIHYDNWLPATIRFILKFEKPLSELPVAYFYTCLALSKKSNTALLKHIEYSKKIVKTSKKIVPVNIEGFAGVLDYDQMPLIKTLISKLVFYFLGIKEGDHRNWKQVYSWGSRVACQFNTILS